MLHTDVKRQIIDETLVEINERIDPLGQLVYFGRDTESGNARLILYTDGDSYGRLVAVGSPRECWQYAKGFLAALNFA